MGISDLYYRYAINKLLIFPENSPLSVIQIEE